MGRPERHAKSGTVSAMRGIGSALLAIAAVAGVFWPVAFDPIRAQDFDVDVTDLARREQARETTPSRGANYYDGEWTGRFSCDARRFTSGWARSVRRTTVALFRDGTWQRETGTAGRSGFETYRITVGPDGKARMEGQWIRGRDRLFQEPISLQGKVFADPENPGVEVLKLKGTRAGAACTMRLARVAGTAADTEQAKQVGVFIEGQAFVAPPRTVRDITAVLDHAPARFPPREQDRALVDEDSPETENQSELVQFYLRRGKAFGRLGDSRRELADLRVAERLSRDGRKSIRNTDRKSVV
jgi:hypothetical protein